MAEQIGYRLAGTVTGVKGYCSAGHKVGDKIELSAHNTGGLCGFSTTISSPISLCSSLVVVIPNNGVTRM